MGRRPIWNFRPVPAVVSALVLTAFASPVFAQDAATRITVNAAEIAIAGRVQAQVNTSNADGVQDAEIILRRVRLGANVRVNDLVSGRVHADFAGNEVSIADAYMQLNLHPAAQLMAGRAYRPFSIMEQTSSLQVIPIERGLSIRGIEDYDLSAILNGLRYGDRDIGLQLRGSIPDAPLGLGYAVGVFAGPEAGDAGGEQTQQFVTRLMANPAPGTRLGVAWSRRDFVREPVEGTFETEGGNAFVLDAEYGGPTPTAGAHIVAEVAMGDFDPFADEDFVGAQVWAGYLIPVGERITLLEPLLRVSHASIDRVDPAAPDGGVLITPGLNIYLGGLNRLMLNFDIWRAATGEDAASGKAQFQLTF
jgi:hypothetical protein